MGDLLGGKTKYGTFPITTFTLNKTFTLNLTIFMFEIEHSTLYLQFWEKYLKNMVEVSEAILKSFLTRYIPNEPSTILVC